MSLLSACELPELGLGDASREPLEATENLSHSLRIQLLPLWLLDERLDLGQAGADQMVTHAVVNLGKDSLEELGVALLEVEHLVDVSGRNQVFNADLLAQNESLVGLADTETLHKSHGAAALGDQADG